MGLISISNNRNAQTCSRLNVPAVLGFSAFGKICEKTSNSEEAPR